MFKRVPRKKWHHIQLSKYCGNDKPRTDSQKTEKSKYRQKGISK